MKFSATFGVLDAEPSSLVAARRWVLAQFDQVREGMPLTGGVLTEAEVQSWIKAGRVATADHQLCAAATPALDGGQT